MMTRTISTIGGTSVLVASNNAVPNILCIEGYCNGNVNVQYFLQLHNVAASSLISGITVPLRSWQILGQDGFTFIKDIGLTIQQLVNPPVNSANYTLALSSTDAVYTTPGITADINVEVEEFELEAAGTTASTNTLITDPITIVADVAPGKRVVSITCQELGGVDTYVQLFSNPTLTNTQTVPFRSLLVPANSTTVFKFGTNGVQVYNQDANGTNHNALVVAASSTINVWTSFGADLVTTVVYK